MPVFIYSNIEYTDRRGENMNKNTKRILLLVISLLLAMPYYLLMQLPEESIVSPWLFFIVMISFGLAASCFFMFLDSFSTIHHFMHKHEIKQLSKQVMKRKKYVYIVLFGMGLAGFITYFIVMLYFYIPLLDGFVGFWIVAITLLCTLFGGIGMIRYSSKGSGYLKSFIKVCILGESFYYEARDIQDIDYEKCKDMVKK